MNRDPQMLMSIQIAFIGIVMVAGFFYIWRSISHIQHKIDDMSCHMINALSKGDSATISRCNTDKCVETVASGIYQKTATDREEEIEEDDDDFSIIKNCFGDLPITTLMDDGNSSFMIFKTTHLGADGLEETPELVIEDVSENKNGNTAKISHDDVSSVSASETNTFSKTYLKKMTIHSLKDMCSSRGLSTDGSKTELIDRILSSIPIA